MLPCAYNSIIKWLTKDYVPKVNTTTLSTPTCLIDSSLLDLRNFLNFIVNPEGKVFLSGLWLVVWNLTPFSIRTYDLS